ncbi:CD209 antigen-like protein C [Trachinotus anak]|uniref:CD209 antigen-like protein C n=1 Tax=Trachinotus anak TaxID=443729 RepID=UPI0039F1D5EF
MEMVIHEEESDMSVEYENVQDATVRSRSGEDSKAPAAAAGVKLYRLVAVSFGLLCFLQAALNISLRLALISDLEARFENMREERNELKRKLNSLERLYFSGSIYYISSIKKNWQESRNECLEKGADLMIINSKEEQDFTRYLKDHMWIGLTDRDAEGTWKWVDGTPVTTSYWASKEPNGKEAENCGEVQLHEWKNNWNDDSCDKKLFWVCEKKVSV